MLDNDQQRLYSEVLTTMEQLIMRCPSSTARNALCDANIQIMRAKEFQEHYPFLPPNTSIANKHR